jgi:transcriptional regulator with XRE-family HTH domain
VRDGRPARQARLVHLPTVLRDARRRHGLSIRAAAARCGVPTSTWADWESGRSTPEVQRFDTVLAALDLDLHPVPRAAEPAGEAVVVRHLRRSLTTRATRALGDQLAPTLTACREAPRLLTGPAAVGVWVPYAVARGPLPLPLAPTPAAAPRTAASVGGLVPLRLVSDGPQRTSAWAAVAPPFSLLLDGWGDHWPMLLTSARLLATRAARDARGRQLPAHRDPDEDREQRDLALALTWAGRGTIPLSSRDSRTWRLDAPATLDEALLRHGLPPRNTSRRGGAPRR